MRRTRQWGYTECTRVGRNLIRVSPRESYEPQPDPQKRFVTPNLNVRPSGLPYAVLYGIVAR
jgi:hypothetical protein